MARNEATSKLYRSTSQTSVLEHHTVCFNPLFNNFVPMICLRRGGFVPRACGLLPSLQTHPSSTIPAIYLLNFVYLNYIATFSCVIATQ
jgi:hypothetical protein